MGEYSGENIIKTFPRVVLQLSKRTDTLTETHDSQVCVSVRIIVRLTALGLAGSMRACRKHCVQRAVRLDYCSQVLLL